MRSRSPAIPHRRNYLYSINRQPEIRFIAPKRGYLAVSR